MHEGEPAPLFVAISAPDSLVVNQLAVFEVLLGNLAEVALDRVDLEIDGEGLSAPVRLGCSRLSPGSAQVKPHPVQVQVVKFGEVLLRVRAECVADGTGWVAEGFVQLDVRPAPVGSVNAPVSIVAEKVYAVDLSNFVSVAPAVDQLVRDRSAYRIDLRLDAPATASLARRLEQARGLYPGKVLADKFELVEQIGRGAMGLVYRARDLDLDMEVALKFVPPELRGDEAEVSRLRLEARRLLMIRHPNIVVVLGFETREGESFAIMEYVPGRNLAEELRRRGGAGVDWPEVWDWAVALCEALDAAHAHGVLHGDLKPANILLGADGSVKLADFGLAREIAASLSSRGSLDLGGTAAYRAPETWRSARADEVGPESDLYALGVVLYETLAGHPPFQGDALQIAHATHNELPRSLTPLSVPDWFDQIILRLLAKDPRDRYPSAEALSADLKRAHPDHADGGVTSGLPAAATSARQPGSIDAILLASPDPAEAERLEMLRVTEPPDLRALRAECVGGNAAACMALSRHYLSVGEVWEARLLLARSARRGNIRALYELGSLLALGQTDSARVLWAAACERGDLDACHALGEASLTDGDAAAAGRAFARAAELGSTRAIQALAQLRERTQQRVEDIPGLELLLVPAGQLRRADGRGIPHESFYIGRFPITNGQYEEFRRETGHRPPLYSRGAREVASSHGIALGLALPALRWFWRVSDPAAPVVGVGYDDATAYCAWLSRRTGWRYRIPTEREWVRAVVGPSEDPGGWGSDVAPPRWWHKLRFRPGAIGQRPDRASEIGCEDFARVSMEWVLDWHGRRPTFSSAEEIEKEELGFRWTQRGGIRDPIRARVGSSDTGSFRVLCDRSERAAPDSDPSARTALPNGSAKGTCNEQRAAARVDAIYALVGGAIGALMLGLVPWAADVARSVSSPQADLELFRRLVEVLPITQSHPMWTAIHGGVVVAGLLFAAWSLPLVVVWILDGAVQSWALVRSRLAAAVPLGVLSIPWVLMLVEFASPSGSPTALGTPSVPPEAAGLALLVFVVLIPKRDDPTIHHFWVTRAPSRFSAWDLGLAAYATHAAVQAGAALPLAAAVPLVAVVFRAARVPTRSTNLIGLMDKIACLGLAAGMLLVPASPGSRAALSPLFIPVGFVVGFRSARRLRLRRRSPLWQRTRARVERLDPEPASSALVRRTSLTVGCPDDVFVHVPDGSVVEFQATGPRRLAMGPFYISKHPVTFRLWQKYMASTRRSELHQEAGRGETSPSRRETRAAIDRALTWLSHRRFVKRWVRRLDDSNAFPIQMSAEEARGYCTWRTRVTGLAHRLPTAREWARAAGGDDGRAFPWGNVEWRYGLESEFTATDDGYRTTVERPLAPLVGRRPWLASPFGVQDLLGSIPQWCVDDRTGQMKTRGSHVGFLQPDLRSPEEMEEQESRRAALLCVVDASVVQSVRAGSLTEWRDVEMRPITAESGQPVFWIGRHPVTNSQYRVFAEATGHLGRGTLDRPGFDHPQQPVTSVSWTDAAAFCAWLGQATGSHYRLPTEAEWKAACGLSAQRPWPWGVDAPGPHGRACLVHQDEEEGPCLVGVTPAGASRWGVEELIGHVAEWLCDAGEPSVHYGLGREPRRAQIGRLDGTRHIESALWGDDEGGLWHWRSSCLMTLPLEASRRSLKVGFRVMRSPFARSGSSSDEGGAVPDPDTPAVIEEWQGLDMLLVPAGEFVMGAAGGRGEARSGRRVALDDFYIGKHPVTNAQYRSFLAATGHRRPASWSQRSWFGWSQPVVDVSWDDAVAFCAWLSGQTGGRYRLPTEAEWEKAALGADGRTYPWGEAEPTAELACFDRRDGPCAVGAHLAGASPHGAQDMAGNVWEWVADGVDAEYGEPGSPPMPDGMPSTPSGMFRVLRGGGWVNPASCLHPSDRRSRGPADHSEVRGFRCARDL